MTDIETKYVKNFQFFTYYDDSEYINYDNFYISLTRQKYSDAQIEYFLQQTPNQLIGGFVDGYVQQITGVTIYENMVYNNDCLSRGRAINNFNERSDFTTFNLPTYVISGATKIYTGTTTASTGVYIVNTLSSITFTASFDSVSAYTESFFVGNNGIKFNLYQKTVFAGGFNGIPIKETGFYINTSTDPLITGNVLNFSALTISFDLTGLEGEFLIKGQYKWTNFTYFSHLIGLEYYEPISNAIFNSSGTFLGLSPQGYVPYNPFKDYYFIYLKNPLKPTLFSDVVTLDSFPLNIITLKPSFDGQTQFPIGVGISSGILVSVNGLTISTDEYVYSSNTLYITGGDLITTDIVNVVYSNQTNAQPLQTETYKITSIPNTTYPSAGQKVIYNTSKNKYEYWLDDEAVNNPVVTLNGQQLTNNIDFYLSSSNKKRIIFENNLYINDIITVFYNSIMNNGNEIFTNNFTVSWTIPEEITNETGYFLVEITNESDSNFTSPLFSGITNYGINQSTYSIDAYIANGSYGDKLIGRVVNNKLYTTISNDLLLLTNNSDNVTFTIKTNALNNY